MEVPDSIEAVCAWRAFRIQKDPHGHIYLASPQQRTLWPHLMPLEAKCRGESVRDMRRHGRCCCGINTFKSQELLEKSFYSCLDIIAEVSLWGSVREYENGYRAQFAYPKHIYVSPWLCNDIVEELTLSYNVPVSRRQLAVSERVEMAQERLRGNEESWFGRLLLMGSGLASIAFIYAM